MNINPFASPCAGVPALKYKYVNIVTPSPVEVKGLIVKLKKYKILNKIMIRKSLKNINLNEIKNKINFGEFRRYSKDVQKGKIKNVF